MTCLANSGNILFMTAHTILQVDLRFQGMLAAVTGNRVAPAHAVALGQNIIGRMAGGAEVTILVAGHAVVFLILRVIGMYKGVIDGMYVPLQVLAGVAALAIVHGMTGVAGFFMGPAAGGYLGQHTVTVFKID